MSCSILLPCAVLRVLHALEFAGYPAYLVGGSLRDAMRGGVPHDFDVTTPATPTDMQRVFEKAGFYTIETGLKHGTLTVLIDGEPIECTTYRVEAGYSDGRHPDAVAFTDRLADDLCRRDFTVNAMACRLPAAAQADFDTGSPMKIEIGVNAELVDLYGGVEDLRQGVLRCVGDPDRRFEEDALRILRCVRFAVQLGFAVEEKTRGALARCRERLSCVSAERCSAEWLRMLGCGMPIEYGLSLIQEAQLWRFVLPGLPAEPDELALLRAASLPSDAPLRIASILLSTHYIYRKETSQPLDVTALAHRSCRALKLSNALTDRIAKLACVDVQQAIPTDAVTLRRLMASYRELTPQALLLRAVFCMNATELRANSFPPEYREATRLCEEITHRGDCLSVGELALKGGDLHALGLRGQQIGQVQAYLLEAVLQDPACNQPQMLARLAQRWLEKAEATCVTDPAPRTKKG